MKIKRSPLKARPLRNPGQSLDEQIRDLAYDYIVWPVLFSILLVTWAAMEWIRFLRPHAPSPRLYTAVAAIAVIFAGYRLVKGLPHMRALRLGRDGEKAVGQFLERLRQRGYQIFHDVVGDGFNIDHILIGPEGVFTVETKTYSKASGDDHIVFNGETIRVGGLEPERNPIVQAKAQASWLRELLSESTGRQFNVTSVILYPGWWVEETYSKDNKVWVLEPKRLEKYLNHEQRRLSPEDIKLASFHLSRFVRTAA